MVCKIIIIIIIVIIIIIIIIIGRNGAHTEKVSVHQIKESPGTSGPRIGPGSRRLKEAINSTVN